MYNLDEISVEELITECTIAVKNVDLKYIWKNEKAKNRFLKKFDINKDIEIGEISIFLAKHNDDVDKGKLILHSLSCYKKLYKQILRDRQNVKKNDKQEIANIREALEDVKSYINVHEKYLNSINNERLGYIIEALNCNYEYNFEIVSTNKYLYEKEMTSKEEMKSIVNKCSKNTLMQILSDSYEDSEYGIDNLRHIIYKYVVINSLNKKYSISDIEDTWRALGNIEIFFEQYIKMMDINVLREVFIKASDHIDIKRMCLKSFYEKKVELQNGIYNKEDREKYCKILKELYSALKGKDVEIMFGIKKYGTNDAKKAMEQFYGSKYYTKNEIEAKIKELSKNGKAPESSYEVAIKEYLNSNKRKIETSEELNLVYKYIFNRGQILQMYLDERIDIETISKSIDNGEDIEIISDEEFLKEYRKMKNIKQEKEEQYEEVENKFNKVKQLYIETNMSTGKRDEHIKKILEKLTNQKDIEELLTNKIIKEEDIIRMTTERIIDRDVFIKMYLDGKIQFETIKQSIEIYNLSEIIDDEQIIEKLIEKRSSENEELDTEIKKLALLYREVKLRDKTEEERRNIADELLLNFEIKLEEDEAENIEIEKEEKIYLYDIGIIPIDTIISWGEEDEIINLVKSDILNFNDIQRMYRENIINDNKIQEIMNSSDISMAKKITLINIIYLEDKEKRNEMLQFMPIESEKIKSQKGENKNNLKKSAKIKNEKQEEANEYIFDTAQRYNAIMLTDKEATVEAFADGHQVFHLPNINGGTVIIEQLYIVRGTKIKDKYGSATYIMSEYDYINRKNDIVTSEEDKDKNKENENDMREKRYKINRTALKELSLKEGIAQRLTHTSQKWIKEMQKILGIPEEIIKAKGEEKLEKVQQKLQKEGIYTNEELERLINLNEAWTRVKESREKVN